EAGDKERRQATTSDNKRRQATVGRLLSLPVASSGLLSPPVASCRFLSPVSSFPARRLDSDFDAIRDPPPRRRRDATGAGSHGFRGGGADRGRAVAGGGYPAARRPVGRPDGR